MQLLNFEKFGGSLTQEKKIFKVNQLDENTKHKRNGLAKLQYDYDHHKHLAHYTAKYFDLAHSSYEEETGPVFVVRYTNYNDKSTKYEVGENVEVRFLELSHAMDLIDKLKQKDVDKDYDEDDDEDDDFDDEEEDWDSDDEDDWNSDNDDSNGTNPDDDDSEELTGASNDSNESADEADEDDDEWNDPDDE